MNDSGRSRSGQPIAVVGATVLQGGATARALLQAHVPVRALARNADSAAATALRGLGADVFPADLEDAARLRSACSGVAAVFAMRTPGRDRPPQVAVAPGRTIAGAAVAAGVPHVVYSSVGGAARPRGLPHFDSKRDVEGYLLEKGLATTFVRP